jgi:hypothetical protein
MRNACAHFPEAPLRCGALPKVVNRAVPGLVAAGLAVVALGACGSGSPRDHVTETEKETSRPVASSDTVVQVGDLPITKPMLNQWMTIEIGADYYSAFKRQVPERLVSEPPNYSVCIVALKRLAPLRGAASPVPLQNVEQLRSRCAQLYQAIKAQALTFLVASDWIINFDIHHGVNVTEEEVEQMLKRVEARQYPRPGQFQESLAARRRTLGQEQFLAKIDLLQQKLEQRIQSGNAKYASLAKELASSANDAVCDTGYVVPHCKQFKGQGYTGPSPSVLLRQVVR